MKHHPYLLPDETISLLRMPLMLLLVHSLQEHLPLLQAQLLPQPQLSLQYQLLDLPHMPVLLLMICQLEPLV